MLPIPNSKLSLVRSRFSSLNSLWFPTKYYFCAVESTFLVTKKFQVQCYNKHLIAPNKSVLVKTHTHNYIHLYTHTYIYIIYIYIYIYTHTQILASAHTHTHRLVVHCWAKLQQRGREVNTAVAALMKHQQQFLRSLAELQLVLHLLRK